MEHFLVQATEDCAKMKTQPAKIMFVPIAAINSVYGTHLASLEAISQIKSYGNLVLLACHVAILSVTTLAMHSAEMDVSFFVVKK